MSLPMRSTATAMTYRLGDGLEFMRSLPADSVDGVFTDPPWGVRLSSGSRGHRRPDIMIQGQSNWLELITAMTDETARVLKPAGKCLIWVGMRHLGATIRAVNALEYRWTVLVAYIPSRFIANFVSRFDPVIYFSRPDAAWPGKGRRGKYIRQEYLKPSAGKRQSNHPCARGQDIVEALIADWWKPGEYIVDPFAGSDTTGVACRILGMRWDSCEIDPKMYETGLQRHSQGHLFEGVKNDGPAVSNNPRLFNTEGSKARRLRVWGK